MGPLSRESGSSSSRNMISQKFIRLQIIIIFHFMNFYFMQKKYFDLSYKHYEENVIIEDMILMNPKNNSAYNLPKIKNTTVYISNINSSFDEKIFRILLR